MMAHKSRTWWIAVLVAAVFLAWFVAATCLIFSQENSESARLVAATLGELGSSFGIVAAAFAGIALVLLFLTYQAQREELSHLRAHLAAEQRRQRVASLVDRLDESIQSVRAGNRSGRDLLDWMNSELDNSFAIGAAGDHSAAQRWESAIEGNVLPDEEPISSVIYVLLGIARVLAQTTHQSERDEIADVLKSVVRRDDVVPILFSAARMLQGRAKELTALEKLLALLDLRPVIVAAYPLSAVPGGIPATIDDTLRAEV